MLDKNHYSLLFGCLDAMTDLDIQELATLTAGDADVDNFERLFTKLKQMKGISENTKKQQGQNTDVDISGFWSAEKASSMPHEQRKVHAEKVSITFSLFILLFL